MVYIVVKNADDGEYSYKLPLFNNRLSLITLKQTFPDSHGLYFRSGEDFVVVGLLSGDDSSKEPFFVEPEDGWANKEFFVKKALSSRPATPMIVESKPTTPQLNEDFASKYIDYVFVSHYSSSGSDSDDSGEVLNASANPYDMSVMKCVAVFRYVKRYFVLTTLHSHEGCGLEVGGDFIFFHGKDEHVAIIRIISEESDFILSELASEPPFEVPHLTTITKHFGLGFLLYGFPKDSFNMENEHIVHPQCVAGRVMTWDRTKEGFYLSQCGSRPGFSGGPAITLDGGLLGICEKSVTYHGHDYFVSSFDLSTPSGLAEAFADLNSKSKEIGGFYLLPASIALDQLIKLEIQQKSKKRTWKNEVVENVQDVKRLNLEL